MKTLQKIDRGLYKAEEIISEVLLAGIIVLVFIAAFMRQIRHPLVWSIDAATLFFVWVCFFGADLAMEKKRHIGVDLITNLFPKRLQDLVRFVTNIVIMAFLAIIVIYGTRLAIINAKDQFQGMELSHSWATASAPVGCVLMLRTLIRQTIEIVRSPETVKEST
jgi:TRAP-type transport system small permease protein